MRTAEVAVYKFDELSDSAKERARDWFRSAGTEDDFDCTLEDAARMATLLGIDLKTKYVPLMGGGTRAEPNIYFSGFSSQGGGASFEGYYTYAKGAAKKIREEAPEDKKLHAIADALQAAQRRRFYRLTASCGVRGRYVHSGCMHVDVSDDGGYAIEQDEEDIRDALRSFADWIYLQLEREYEWRNADEQVDENIAANDYEFDASGELF